MRLLAANDATRTESLPPPKGRSRPHAWDVKRAGFGTIATIELNVKARTFTLTPLAIAWRSAPPAPSQHATREEARAYVAAAFEMHRISREVTA